MLSHLTSREGIPQFSASTQGPQGLACSSSSSPARTSAASGGSPSCSALPPAPLQAPLRPGLWALPLSFASCPRGLRATEPPPPRPQGAEEVERAAQCPPKMSPPPDLGTQPSLKCGLCRCRQGKVSGAISLDLGWTRIQGWCPRQRQEGGTRGGRKPVEAEVRVRGTRPQPGTPRAAGEPGRSLPRCPQKASPVVTEAVMPRAGRG